MADQLLKTIAEIRERASAFGLVVFYGWLYTEEAHTVHWNEEHGGHWKQFLECARALSVKAIYLNWAPFEEFQVDEALAGVEGVLSDAQTTEMEKAELESQSKQIAKYRDKVGLTAIIDVAFEMGGMFHVYQETADWFDAFQELTAEEEEKQVEEETQVDKALVDKWARELASHAKYSSCKDYDQGAYLLEKLAGEGYEKLPLSDIFRRAETIYQFELKPQEEERLSQKARELRKQGLNMNAIAQKLGISRDRVSGLLAE